MRKTALLGVGLFIVAAVMAFAVTARGDASKGQPPSSSTAAGTSTPGLLECPKAYAHYVACNTAISETMNLKVEEGVSSRFAGMSVDPYIQLGNEEWKTQCRGFVYNYYMLAKDTRDATVTKAYEAQHACSSLSSQGDLNAARSEAEKAVCEKCNSKWPTSWPVSGSGVPGVQPSVQVDRCRTLRAAEEAKTDFFGGPQPLRERVLGSSLINSLFIRDCDSAFAHYKSIGIAYDAKLGVCNAVATESLNATIESTFSERLWKMTTDNPDLSPECAGFLDARRASANVAWRNAYMGWTSANRSCAAEPTLENLGASLRGAEELVCRQCNYTWPQKQHPSSTRGDRSQPAEVDRCGFYQHGD